MYIILEFTNYKSQNSHILFSGVSTSCDNINIHVEADACKLPLQSINRQSVEAIVKAHYIHRKTVK